MTAKTPPRFRRIAPEQRRQSLIEAGLACLARGGILGFTIDNICAEAQVSRGLITHHFGSKDNLLAAIYEMMIARLMTAVEAEGSGRERIARFIDASFAAGTANRDSLKMWLAVWGEVANQPALLKQHRKQYARYRSGVENALAALAAESRRDVDVPFTAMMLISLIDGLWLEWCIDPRQISADDAKAACRKLLEPVFGTIV